MLKKILLVFGLSIVASISVQAQDTAELFGGFSYMRFHSSNLNGWEVAGQYKFADWIGGVADFDGHYGSINGVGTSTHTFLFGPQISVPSSLSPFAHLLLGGAHNSTGGFGSSSFSMALGGGVDAEVGNSIHWRLIQADYLMTQFGGGSQNNFRFSTGILFRF
ncbi:MAG TPA: hypothetical protein VG498_14535 [Terriglobales bacterium]|nr:hypothetical protein [Terriglobales bacterium]